MAVKISPKSLAAFSIPLLSAGDSNDSGGLRMELFQFLEGFLWHYHDTKGPSTPIPGKKPETTLFAGDSSPL